MSEKKKTLLRNLKIKSVSMVDQGANQHAHVLLTKRAEDETQEEKPVENTDKAFFERLGEMVAKFLHIHPKQHDVEKDGHTYAEVDGAREVNDQVWRVIDALGESLRSIVNDNELTDTQKAEMINTTADEVAASIKSDIAGIYSGGAVIKGAEDETGNEGAGNEPEPDAHEADQPQGESPAANTDPDIQKGAETDMKFNTENMTPEEKAMLEDLQKRFGVEEPAPAPANDPATAAEDKPADDGDIYKGLHPAIRAELEAGRRLREQIEERELNAVAKKYELLGRKPEELVPVLKSLKAAGGDAYNQMISMLDANLAAVEAAGTFGEIGKSGNGGGDDPWAQIEACGEEIRKSNPDLSYAEAIDRACIQHPELVAAYEKSRR